MTSQVLCLRDQFGRFVPGTPQPYGFKKGNIPWNKKNLNVQLIKELNDKGCTEKEIAKILNVDRHTVRRVCRENGVKLKIYRFDKRVKPDLSSSPHLAYLLGALLGDGNVFSKGTRNIASLKVSEYRFAYNVCEAMKTIGLRPRLRQSKNNYNGNMMWLTYAISKNFCGWYKSLTYADIKKIAVKHPKDFLRGFYESEGCAHLRQKRRLSVTFANDDLNLIEIAKDCLAVLGYKCSIHTSRKGNYAPTYHLYVMGTTDEKFELLHMINPCIKNPSGSDING
jgi:intein-encoded DNA endonuclease-like protein